jgi:hypothetical protein
MTKTTTILGFSIVLALVIGIVSSGSIAEAVKPLTEMIIANDETNPVPVEVQGNIPVEIQGTVTVTGISSSPVCPADKVQHWYTVRITQSLSFIELRSPTSPTIFDEDEFWIQVHHESDDVIDFHDSVIDRLTELGYEAFNLNTNTNGPLLYSYDWITIDFLEVGTHTTICAES